MVTDTEPLHSHVTSSREVVATVQQAVMAIVVGDYFTIRDITDYAYEVHGGPTSPPFNITSPSDIEDILDFELSPFRKSIGLSACSVDLVFTDYGKIERDSDERYVYERID